MPTHFVFQLFCKNRLLLLTCFTVSTSETHFTLALVIIHQVYTASILITVPIRTVIDVWHETRTTKRKVTMHQML